MYIWILVSLAAGVTVAVLFALLCIVLSLSTKSWINDGTLAEEENGSKKDDGKGQNMVVTDPYSGKVMNLERVSNASSLRSTKSVGFIAYDNPNASHNGSNNRGRVTPLFHTGSMRSVKSNRSVSTSAGFIHQEMKNMNVNPLFEEDEAGPSNEPWLSNSTQMRARGLVFE